MAGLSLWPHLLSLREFLSKILMCDNNCGFYVSVLRFSILP